MSNYNVPGYTHIQEVARQTLKRINSFRDGTERPMITSSKTYNDKIGGHIWGEQVGIVAQ